MLRKNEYYNAKNKKIKEEQWIEELTKIRLYSKNTFQIHNSALLILDMQNIFLDPSSHAYIPSAKTIIPNIQQLIQFFEEKQQPIIFTQHISSNSKSDPMKNWWRAPILTNSQEAQIYEGLKSDSSSFIIKHTYDAFHSTELENHLHEQNIKNLVITGVMTHLCCETTAREAFKRGYSIWFPLNTSASYTENFHLGSLRAIHHGFGECIISEEILQKKY